MTVESEAERSQAGAASNGKVSGGGQAAQRRLLHGIVWPDDIQVIFDKDPAAKNVFEVLLYQSFHAVLLHRLAHRLYRAGVPILPRLISQMVG